MTGILEVVVALVFGVRFTVKLTVVESIIVVTNFVSVCCSDETSVGGAVVSD